MLSFRIDEVLSTLGPETLRRFFLWQTQETSLYIFVSSRTPVTWDYEA